MADHLKYKKKLKRIGVRHSWFVSKIIPWRETINENRFRELFWQYIDACDRDSRVKEYDFSKVIFPPFSINDQLYKRKKLIKRCNFKSAIFTGKADFRGVDVLDRIAFDGVKFNGDTYFNNVVFDSLADFSRATFFGRASFSGCFFAQIVFFNNASFSGSSNSFKNVTFKERASFEKTEFLGRSLFVDSSFENIVSFRDSVFSSDVSFLGSKFLGESRFNDVRFEDVVVFSSAVFSLSSDFSASYFLGNAVFIDVRFVGESRFLSVNFEADASFERSIFASASFFDKCSFSGDTNFLKVKFEKRVSFESSVFFGDSYFEGAAYHREVNFDVCIFQKNAVFIDAVFGSYVGFSNAKFVGDPVFARVKFNGYINFISCIFLGESNFSAASFLGYSDFRAAEFQGKLQLRQAVFHDELHFEKSRFLFLKYPPQSAGVDEDKPISLDGAILEAVHLWGIDELRNYSFKDSFLLGLSFSKKRFIGCDFTGAVMKNIHTDGWKVDDLTVMHTKYIYTDYKVVDFVEDDGEVRTILVADEQTRVPADGNFGQGDNRGFDLKEYFHIPYEWNYALQLPSELRVTILNAIQFFRHYAEKAKSANVEVNTKTEGRKVRVIFQVRQEEERERVEGLFHDFIERLFSLEGFVVEFENPSLAEQEKAEIQIRTTNLQQQVNIELAHQLEMARLQGRPDVEESLLPILRREREEMQAYSLALLKSAGQIGLNNLHISQEQRVITGPQKTEASAAFMQLLEGLEAKNVLSERRLRWIEEEIGAIKEDLDQERVGEAKGRWEVAWRTLRELVDFSSKFPNLFKLGEEIGKIF